MLLKPLYNTLMAESQTTQVTAPTPEGQWQFHAEDGSAETEDVTDATTAISQDQDIAPVTWTASEFIAHHKSASWYVVLVLLTAAFGGLIFWLTHDYVTVALIAVAAILFGVMASRKPRELQYQIDGSGIHVGEKLYTYSSFKSFAVVQEEGVESIWFLPLKRFMPSLSIYFAPQDKDKIVGALSGALPFEHRQLDPLDKVIHKIRF